MSLYLFHIFRRNPGTHHSVPPTPPIPGPVSFLEHGRTLHFPWIGPHFVPWKITDAKLGLYCGSSTPHIPAAFAHFLRHYPGPGPDHIRPRKITYSSAAQTARKITGLAVETLGLHRFAVWTPHSQGFHRSARLSGPSLKPVDAGFYA